MLNLLWAHFSHLHGESLGIEKVFIDGYNFSFKKKSLYSFVTAWSKNTDMELGSVSICVFGIGVLVVNKAIIVTNNNKQK